MNNRDLAEFYGVTDRAVRKWSPERKRKARAQALAGAEPEICHLIAKIAKLAYIYDCQWLHGIEQKRACLVERTPWRLTVSFFVFGEDSSISDTMRADMMALDSVQQLIKIVNQLEEVIYGV